jgi:cobalamin biosynthetic protein CobC
MTERNRAPLPHGGHLGAARRLFPGAPEPWLDLSTGINPLPYPMPPLPPDCITRLPEPEAVTRLEGVAAAAYGVSDPACVVAAPGTQVLINLLPRLWPLPDIAILGPTYAEHAHAWALAGSRVHAVTDPAALDACRGAALCNPNNPDGRRTAPAELVALADRVAARGGLLVVDEAFMDLEGPGLSVAGALPHPALVVLRSFGKTHGLAGLRLGFALATPDRADAIRAALGPGWRDATAARLAADVTLLDALLSCSGLTIVGGTRLFRLAETAQAAELFARLGRSGVLVRRFADQPHRLRFGLPGNEADFDRLRAVLSPTEKSTNFTL